MLCIASSGEVACAWQAMASTVPVRRARWRAADNRRRHPGIPHLHALLTEHPHAHHTRLSAFCGREALVVAHATCHARLDDWTGCIMRSEAHFPSHIACRSSSRSCMRKRPSLLPPVLSRPTPQT